MEKLDLDTLRWAAKMVRSRKATAEALGYTSAALCAFEEVYICLAASAERVARGETPYPTSKLE